MARHPREVPVNIPRPPRSRPGDPPPWEGQPPGAVPLEVIRRRLHGFRPRRNPPVPAAGVLGSAVLVPLVGEDDVSVVLGKRSAFLPSHRGDISFPGGREHPEDTDLEATALREAEEEMGMRPHAVEVIAELDHLGTMGSRFEIAPFVGVVSTDPGDFVPQEGEVDRILIVPLRRLMEPGVYRQEIWSGPPPAAANRGPEDPTGQWANPGAPLERPVHFFEVDEWDIVWGATATILRQLLEIVTRPD